MLFKANQSLDICFTSAVHCERIRIMRILLISSSFCSILMVLDDPVHKFEIVKYIQQIIFKMLAASPLQLCRLPLMPPALFQQNIYAMRPICTPPLARP